MNPNLTGWGGKKFKIWVENEQMLPAIVPLGTIYTGKYRVPYGTLATRVTIIFLPISYPCRDGAPLSEICNFARNTGQFVIVV